MAKDEFENGETILTKFGRGEIHMSATEPGRQENSELIESGIPYGLGGGFGL